MSILCALAGAGCGTGGPTPTGIPTSAAGPTPTPVATSRPSPTTPVATGTLGREWALERISLPIAGIPVAMAAGPAGVVAVGFDEAEGGETSASWRSADGGSWIALPPFPGTDGDAQVRVVLVAANPAGYLAVGHGGNPRQALAWWSADGRAWRAVGTETEGCPTGAAWDGERWVVVGFIGPCDSGGTYHPATWTSANASSWRRTEVEVVGLPPFGILEGVVATDAGFVARARLTSRPCDVGCPIERLGGTPLVSRDGVTWQPVVGPFDHATVQGMTATTAGWVAFGGTWSAPGSLEGNLLPTVWTSVDGRTWKAGTGDLPVQPDDDARLLGAGSVALLVATAWDSAGTPRTRIWYSADGERWQPSVTAFADAEIAVALPLGDAILALGNRVERRQSDCTQLKGQAPPCPVVPARWVSRGTPTP